MRLQSLVMGRGTKTVLTDSGLDRRVAGYYSTPDFVAEFLAAQLLKLAPDARRVFDPCVGKEELLAPYIERGLECNGFDIEDFAAHHQYKYGCRFERVDFLKYYAEWQSSRHPTSLPHDLLVANPPYNCHEADYVRVNKKRLVGAFPDVGVGNTFAMFMAALIDMAADGAFIGLLTFDSFLTARMHAPLRRRILSQCAVHLVALCPTDLFHQQNADVRTSLVILQKGKNHQPPQVKTANRPSDTLLFRKQLAAGRFVSESLADLTLGENDHLQFIIGCPPDVKALFAGARLGDVFECVTGISTGNDARYLSARRRAPFTVPFYKNPGRQRFRYHGAQYIDADFLEISRRVPNFIVRNQHLLFKEGVSCSSMGVSFAATYLPAGTLFGVNANIFPQSDDIWWLLAYLNSTLVTYLVRGVLLRTNMITSGYVSRIPLIAFSSAEKRRLSAVARRAFESGSHPFESELAEIDDIVFAAAALSARSRTLIGNFCSDLLRTT